MEQLAPGRRGTGRRVSPEATEQRAVAGEQRTPEQLIRKRMHVRGGLLELYENQSGQRPEDLGLPSLKLQLLNEPVIQGGNTQGTASVTQHSP